MPSKTSYAISHHGHRERVRARMINGGLEHFLPHEMLEYLLFAFVPRKDTKQIAYAMLERFGSFASVLEAEAYQLEQVSGVTHNAALFIASLLPIHRAYVQDKWGEKPMLNGAAIASEYAISLFTGRTHEVFFMLCLDTAYRMTNAVMVCEGSINELPVYPRVIAEIALRNQASMIIFAHNHPGGNCVPSLADITATKKLLLAMYAIDVDVLDHIVISGNDFCSMAAAQLIAPPDQNGVDQMGMFRQQWRESPDLSNLRASVASWAGINAQDKSIKPEGWDDEES